MYNANNRITQKLLLWYSKNKRLLPLEKLMIHTRYGYRGNLQQTKVKTVIPYYKRWLKRYPTLQSAAEASTDRLFKLWEGLGYYQRCRNFHRALKIVATNYNGKIPSSFDYFINLPGVGEYTAGAVLSIALTSLYPLLMKR